MRGILLLIIVFYIMLALAIQLDEGVSESSYGGISAPACCSQHLGTLDTLLCDDFKTVLRNTQLFFEL